MNQSSVFDVVEISVNRAMAQAKREGQRCLSYKQMCDVECSAAWRNRLILENKILQTGGKHESKET